MRRETLDEVGDWLKANNVSVFTFPDMETGMVFWIVRQPAFLPAGKGRTLAEALEKAGII